MECTSTKIGDLFSQLCSLDDKSDGLSEKELVEFKDCEGNWDERLLRQRIRNKKRDYINQTKLEIVEILCAHRQPLPLNGHKLSKLYFNKFGCSLLTKIRKTGFKTIKVFAKTIPGLQVSCTSPNVVLYSLVPKVARVRATQKNEEEAKCGFSPTYWENNYSDLHEMDGISNAEEHAAYIHSLFNLERIDVGSIIDFGFGLGHMLRELILAFKPKHVSGVEPSDFAFLKAQELLKLNKSPKTRLNLLKDDLVSWCSQPLKGHKNGKVFDLGICTEVFQYMSMDAIEKVIPVMAKRVKYLYFTVMTDEEAKLQKVRYGYHDKYGTFRKQREYLEVLQPHFAFVSSRLLESKEHFNRKTTNFETLLYRFDGSE